MSKEKCFTVFLYLFSFLTLNFTIVSLYKIMTTVAPDFKIYYESAKNLSGFFISNNSNMRYIGYPLVPTMFFLPFAFFPYGLAQGLFVLLSMGATILILLISFKSLNIKVSLSVFLFALSLVSLSFPVKFTLGMGQINLISALFLILNYFYYKEKKFVIAGLFLGLSIWTKPVVGMMILFYLMSFKKNWRLLLATFVFLVSLSILGLLLFGVENNKHFLEAIPILLNFSGREVYYNQGLMGFVSRLTGDVNLRLLLSLVSGIFVFLLVIFSTLKNRYKDIQFSLFIIAFLLFDPLSWQHHFVFLIFPFIVAFYYIQKSRSKKLLLWFIISYLLVSINIRQPDLFLSFPWVLILSHLFYGSTILFFILLYNLTSLIKSVKVPFGVRSKGGLHL